MFTGRWRHELNGGFYSPADDTHPTLAEILGQQGYLTAGFVANNWYGGAEFGLNRGFAHYEAHKASVMAALTSTSVGVVLERRAHISSYLGQEEKFNSKKAARVNDDFLLWLSARDPSRPYFAFLNYFDAHAPYLVADDIGRRFTSMPPQFSLFDGGLQRWSPEQIRGLNGAYDATIAYLDRELGHLIGELDRQGSLQNTILIVTADHGEQFGEHGLLEHANSLYMPLLHVPLFIVYPGFVPSGQRVHDFVSLRDLAATVMDLARVRQPSGFPGRSLAEFWKAGGTSEPATRMLLSEADQVSGDYPDWYPARKGPMKSLLFNSMHYIKNGGNGREELYDLSATMEESDDLSARRPDLLLQYREYLNRQLRSRN